MIKRRLVAKLGVGVLCTLLIAGAFESPAGAAPVPVTADDETVPVATSGDSADDPAIWVNQANPSQSIVIGNDKGDALEVYDLAGNRIQRITGGHGNVDVRTGFPLGSTTVDIAAAASSGIRVYRINPTTRQLTNITEGGMLGIATGEGFCLYHSPVSGLFYAFIISQSGSVRQIRLGDTNGNGLVDGQLVRSFSVGSESEGCVADDERGLFYVSQEDVALWRYGAEPGASTTRVRVDSVGSGGNLAADIEGLAIVNQANGTGYLLASAQNVADPNNSYFTVYERQGANAFLKSFRVVAGSLTDDCSRTDGIAAVAANLGPNFPQGLFVCQDNGNTTPGTSGNQNFKFVRLEKILTLDGNPPPPPDDTTPPETTITSGPPASTSSTSATFAFTASEPGSTFLCKRDSDAETACNSGISYSNLAVGPHHFQVKATDPAGNTDQSPATWDWEVTSSPPPPPPPTTGTISTVAGRGAIAGFSGDGGQATSALLRAPRTMEADAQGNLYITDTENHRVRKVDSTGRITTLAGTGTAGYSGDNGPATSARLNNPHGVAVDGAGNVYIADSPNQRIRKVSTNGTITTVAGTGTSGYNGDNIQATSARLNYPKGVEVGPDGALYIGDANNHRVRRVDLSTGVITTVAGTGVAGSSGDGGPATSARLNTPRNMAFGTNGDMYIADDLNYKVRRVSAATKTISTVAGTGVAGYGGDGGSATSARMNEVRDVAVDGAGNLYIADEKNHRIRWVDTGGIMRTFAGTGVSGFSGNGGPATSARIRGPRGVAVDPSGRVLIGDTGNHVIRRVA